MACFAFFFLTDSFIAYLPIRIAVSWDVTRCGLVDKYRRFGEICLLLSYVRRKNEAAGIHVPSHTVLRHTFP